MTPIIGRVQVICILRHDFDHSDRTAYLNAVQYFEDDDSC